VRWVIGIWDKSTTEIQTIELGDFPSTEKIIGKLTLTVDDADTSLCSFYFVTHDTAS
jgi:hypothetical protein